MSDSCNINKSLNASQLLCCGQKYFIPNYQRNYAWDIAEVRQLVQDVADMKRRGGSDYFVGNLIVRLDHDNPASGYETIDGQQRLTTLYILICALRKHGFADKLKWFSSESLEFRNRQNSNESMKAISTGDFEFAENRENHIIDVCRCIYPIVESICQRECNGDIEGFVDYFMSSVQFLRIEIPQGVDRNHYFEVMNSRGVQLTPSEVVKAEMMEVLSKEPEHIRNVFSYIWNACSNMERYVVMNINSTLRTSLFGNKWTTIPVQRLNLGNEGLSERFDVIANDVSKSKLGYSDSDIKPESLREMLIKFENGIGSNTSSKKSNYEEEDNQYYSVISFPNFLLHVLRIMYPQNRSDIALDDKELTKIFGVYLKMGGVSFVKQFAMLLLRTRFLFDKYVVRRDSHDKWVLNQVVENQQKPEYKKTFGEGSNDDKENEILLLLEMFHVSNPTQNHKNWLSAVLSFVSENPVVGMSDYRDYLRSLALSFMRKRFLTTSPQDYDKFLFNDDGSIVKRPSEDNYNVDDSLLDNGVNVENFVFNYYDYIVWAESKSNQKYGIDYKQFEYSYRNSVEHFYPQNPRKDELMPLQDRLPHNHEGEKLLNCFGNLCLITPNQNSRFTNDPPKAKYDRFKNNTEVTKQSLKLQQMFSIVEHDDWDIKQIKDFNSEAHNLMLKRIK